jgi:hypothetical protein
MDGQDREQVKDKVARSTHQLVREKRKLDMKTGFD